MTEETACKIKRVYAKKHGDNIHEFVVDWTVTVHIPWADRTAMDLQHLPCETLELSWEKTITTRWFVILES